MADRNLSTHVEEWKKELWGDGMTEQLEWLLDRGLDSEYVDKYQFGYVKEGYFGNSISIPVMDGMGDIVSCRYRRLDPDATKKYDQNKGQRAHIFNVSSVRHHTVHICEGEFDATIMEQLGRHAVGIPGIQNFRPEWKWLFVGNDVRLVFDADERGSEAYKATKRSILQIKKLVEAVADRFEVVELPEGNDITDLYCSNPDLLKEILDEYDE